jgi:hypothetical protein
MQLIIIIIMNKSSFPDKHHPKSVSTTLDTILLRADGNRAIEGCNFKDVTWLYNCGSPISLAARERIQY